MGKRKNEWPGSAPKTIIDDDGVRHQIEVEEPASYKAMPCPCGIIHLIEMETWYHSILEMDSAGTIKKVIKKCKTCHKILLKELG